MLQLPSAVRSRRQPCRRGDSLPDARPVSCYTCGRSKAGSISPATTRLHSASRSSLIPRRKRGISGFVKFLLFVVLVTGGAFVYTIVKYHESPQETWKRLVAKVDEEAEPAPTPAPLPEAATATSTPMPTAAPVAVEMRTPVPASTASPDPLSWLLEHKNYWPKTVTLLEPGEFPVVFNGKVVGSASILSGTTVKIVEIKPNEIGVVFNGGGKRIPPKATNLRELAKLEMERPEPTPASTPEVALAPAATTTPAATPFTAFRESSDADNSDTGSRADQTV
jgi:hypothetical protein